MVLKKHNKENNYTQNRLRHKASDNWRDVLIISTMVRKTRPCRVRTPLIKHLSQTKVVVMAATLIHRVETMVVELELVSVTGQL